MRNKSKPLLSRSKKGFTLIELIVVMSIVATLMTVIATAAKRIREQAGIKICQNNIKNITVAMMTYYYERGFFPDGLPYATLPDQLAGYIGNKNIFICPADEPSISDSYTAYYVCPGNTDSNRYVLGCSRHRNDKIAVGYYTKYHGAQSMENVGVTVNGSNLKSGSNASGTFVLDDGTTIDSGEISMQIVHSSRFKGNLHTILRVYKDEIGSISVNAATGTHLEIVTPAMVAAVRGTAFTIDISYDEEMYQSKVTVTEGKVMVTPLHGLTRNGADYIVMNNNSQYLEPGMSTTIYRYRPEFEVEVDEDGQLTGLDRAAEVSGNERVQELLDSGMQTGKGKKH